MGLFADTGQCPSYFHHLQKGLPVWAWTCSIAVHSTCVWYLLLGNLFTLTSSLFTTVGLCVHICIALLNSNPLYCMCVWYLLLGSLFTLVCGAMCTYLYSPDKYSTPLYCMCVMCIVLGSLFILYTKLFFYKV